MNVFSLSSIGEIAPGADLADEIAAALRAEDLALEPGDILVVTQKIASKAEGRLVDLAGVTVGPEAIRLAAVTGKDPRLVELVLAESSAVVRAAPNVLITRHRTGHVMANAGIDRSNLGSDADAALLLPEDADASAERLHTALARRWPVEFGVVISDSFGRPWRHGVTNVAIGCNGCPALVDRRGEVDRDGRPLEVTQVALADMAACAAGLVTGEGAEGVPAALIRGLRWSAPAGRAADLIRPPEQDLFR